MTENSKISNKCRKHKEFRWEGNGKNAQSFTDKSKWNEWLHRNENYALFSTSKISLISLWYFSSEHSVNWI